MFQLEELQFHMCRPFGSLGCDMASSVGGEEECPHLRLTFQDICVECAAFLALFDFVWFLSFLGD